MKKILESDDDGEIGDSFETTVDHPPVIIKVIPLGIKCLSWPYFFLKYSTTATFLSSAYTS